MPLRHDPRFPYRNELEMPVIGLESEFKVFIDDVEVTPEDVWRTPSAFIDRPLLKRTSKSSQLPTGGAVYFDGGVIEVVTPVIEIAPQCTARVVRSLWEQIGFVRAELDRWEERTGRRVRLQAFSCHCNISFELSRGERSRDRTIQKLATLLAHLLPVPVIVVGANRKSTGIGVRPRRDRIEITLDFTPDPGLMSATIALIVGIVRDVIAWPSYRLDHLERLPMLADVNPGRHPARNGWVVRDYHFPRNPFTADPNASEWTTRDGSKRSLREIALDIATAFRDSIRRYADKFSFDLLFSVLRGETPSLLDLRDRPPAYDDVGRTARWGDVIPEMRAGGQRRADVERLLPPWRGEPVDRRTRVRFPAPHERRTRDRRAALPAPRAPRLSRSAYERVFQKLGSGKRVRIGGEILTPVAVKGWYHTVLVDRSGHERLLSIDQILQSGEWRE